MSHTNSKQIDTMKNEHSNATFCYYPVDYYNKFDDIIDSEMEWQRESYMGSGLSDEEIEQQIDQLQRARHEFFTDPESYDPRCLDLSPVSIDGCLASVAGTSSIGKHASATEKPNKECHDTIQRLLQYLKQGDINKICNKAGVSDYVFMMMLFKNNLNEMTPEELTAYRAFVSTARRRRREAGLTDTLPHTA